MPSRAVLAADVYSRGSSLIFSISVRMSSARHAVIRGPRPWTGRGNLPALTPAHQVERETGMIGGTAGREGVAGLPTIWVNRT